MQTTAGIYLYSKPIQKFLICHATRSGNFWSIPKGLIDEGEDAYTAAVRELYEECNIDLSTLHILEKYEFSEKIYKSKRKELKSFLIIVKEDLSDHPLECHSLVNGQYPEVDKFRWVKIDEMCSEVHHAQQANCEEIRRLV